MQSRAPSRRLRVFSFDDIGPVGRLCVRSCFVCFDFALYRHRGKLECSGLSVVHEFRKGGAQGIFLAQSIDKPRVSCHSGQVITGRYVSNCV
jgi:hypothetical protein